MARKKLTFEEWASKQQQGEGQFFVNWLNEYLQKFGYKKFHQDKNLNELDRLIIDVKNANIQMPLFADQLKRAWHSYKHGRRNKVATLSISTTKKVKKKFQDKAKKLGVSQTNLIEELLLNDEANTDVGSISVARRALKKLKEMELQKEHYENELQLPAAKKLRQSANSMLMASDNVENLFFIIADELTLCRVYRGKMHAGIVSLMGYLQITDEELKNITDDLKEKRNELDAGPEW